MIHGLTHKEFYHTYFDFEVWGAHRDSGSNATISGLAFLIREYASHPQYSITIWF